MLKIGVIGLGKLGSIHQRIYEEIPDVKSILLVDTDKEKLTPFLEKHSCSTDYHNLTGKVDLVSIATPTCSHYEIAQFFLKKQIPVLVEKPLTTTVAQAQKLIKLAKKQKTLISVGHVERYNNAYLAIKDIVKNPLFIECHRLSPYPFRSLDVSVVVDVMIHDLDIILNLLKSNPIKIDAKGVKVLSSNADIANVRLTFKNGCVANITASRISAKRERKIRIFMHNCYISLDYATQEVEIYRKIKTSIEKEILPIKKEEPLKKEILDFIDLVKKKSYTTAYAQKAKDALALALKIQKKINTSN